MLSSHRPRVHLGHLPTRLERWPALGRELGVDLWIKHEFEADAFGSGNKVRKLEFLLAHLTAGDYAGVLLDGSTQSNCAMALAHYAPRFDLQVELILYGPTEPVGNYVDILSSTARITHLPGWSPATVAAAAERITNHAHHRGERLYHVPTGATNTITAYAALDLAEELYWQQSDTGVGIKHLVFATGTGGTQAGLDIATQELDAGWRLHPVAVANEPAFFHTTTTAIAESAEMTAHTRPAPFQPCARVYTAAQGPGYGQPLPGSTAEIRRLRRDYGLVLDSVYTFKAFVGLRQLIESRHIPPESTVVFIHTGGINERFHPPPGRDVLPTGHTQH